MAEPTAVPTIVAALTEKNLATGCPYSACATIPELGANPSRSSPLSALSNGLSFWGIPKPRV